MSEIEKAFELINVFASKAAEVAPVVWSKMIMLVQAESIAYLMVGGFCLGFSGILATISLKMKLDKYDDWTPAKIITGIASLVVLVPACVNLLYP